MVDEVLELDQRNRDIKQEVEALRADRNKISKEIGACMAQGKKEEAEELKKKVQANADRVEALSAEEKEVEARIKKIMMTIPNIIDPSVPIGKDDSENVEIEKFGEPVVPDFEIPYHTEIMESLQRHRSGERRKSCRKRVLLSDGRYCQTSFRSDRLCPRFHDQPWIHLLCPALHDPQQRGDRRYELRGDGRHDV